MPTRFHLNCGPSEAHTLAREFFQRAGFDAETVCRVLAIESMGELGKVRWEQLKPDAMAERLRWCLDVFVRGLAATEESARKLCGEETLGALRGLGLLRPARKDSASLVCPVWLYPADAFIVASDRRDDPDGEPFSPPEDVVFPAIYGGTLRFLRLLPAVGGGTALDLCGGSGIGALRLARTASEALTADLTERAALFAQFNARINGTNVTSLRGDLYAPVEGRRFDVISAHPPFVPATGPNMIYRDGGASGEEVTRRTIEGIPAHLQEGGRALVLCVARDTEEGTFEQRAQKWLGAAAEQFEVVFGLEKVLSVEELVESVSQGGQRIKGEEARTLSERLHALGTRQFVYGALFMQRFDQAIRRDPFRIRMSDAASASDFERLLAWRNHCRQPGFVQWLANSRPRLAPNLELTARHKVREGELVPAEFVFSVEGAFESALRPDGFVVPLLARLNGQQSVGQSFEASRNADELPDGFTLEPFLGLVQRMVDLRLLEVELPISLRGPP